MNGENQDMFNDDEAPKLYVRLVGNLEVPLRADGLTVPTDGSFWTQEKMDSFIRAYRITMKPEMAGFTFVMFLYNITFVKQLEVNDFIIRGRIHT